MMDGSMNERPGESPADLIEQLRRKYVKTPRDRAFLDHLGRVLRQTEDGRLTLEPARFGPEGETRGVIVAAPPGEGKSSLIGHALSGFRQVDSGQPAATDADDDVAPSEPVMLRLITPSPGGMKSLGLEILKKTGYAEVADRRERWSIWKVVRRQIALKGVRLLWLDEAQHILGLGGAAEQRAALDAIKTLMMGENACAVVLSGLDVLELVRRVDPQIERRFTFFRPQRMVGPKERRRLKAILTEFCGEAALGAPVEPDIVDRILHAVDDRFGCAIEVMVEAVALAVKQHSKVLDLQHFSESWAITSGCEPSLNAFIAEKWADIPSKRDTNDEASHSGKKTRSRANRREGSTP
jgi:hypothetical protein